MPALVFDMDGVLTDSEPIICAAATAMFAEHGITVQPEDFHPFVGAGENKYVGGVAAKYGLHLPVEELKARTYALYLAMVPGRLQAFPGVHALIAAARAAGYQVAVASSADLIKVNANLIEIGLPPSGFDAVITAEKAVNKKPAPDIFLAAARELGRRPSECVVVEDAINGVEAARAAGSPVIAVCTSFPADRLTAANLVVPALADITLAHVAALLKTH